MIVYREIAEEYRNPLTIKCGRRLEQECELMKLGEDKEEELDEKGLIGVDKKMGDYVFVRKESSMRKDGGDV